MDLTPQQLSRIIPSNTMINDWYNALMQCLPDYEIDTPERMAAFLAQCAHESSEFKTLKENLNYKWESLRRVFPKYFHTDEMAQQYAHNQEMIANLVYSNRMGNGDEASGDGFRYCGRGLIQLTGKNNYQLFADSIETPLEQIPEYLGTFEGAVQSACWFWEQNQLNKWADAGDIDTISRIINGGTIGLEDRRQRYQNALAILGA